MLSPIVIVAILFSLVISGGATALVLNILKVRRERPTLHGPEDRWYSLDRWSTTR